MPIWTYVRNQEAKSKVGAISLRGGTLILRIGTYANLTNEEVNEILDGGAGVVLEEGIIQPATSAGGESAVSTATFIYKWTANTKFYENQLVTHEGELLRVLRNFTSGETYEF